MTQPTPQPRTYLETLLLPITLTSQDWARTWLRQFMRDYPEVRTGGVNPGQPVRDPVWPEFSRTDAALNASLFLDAVQVDVNGIPTPHYRPHFTAARLYLGDPNLWRTRSVDGSSETRRDPQEVIRAWLNQGRAFDALFPAGVVLPAFEAEPETVSSGEDEWIAGIPLVVSGL